MPHDLRMRFIDGAPEELAADDGARLGAGARRTVDEREDWPAPGLVFTAMRGRGFGAIGVDGAVAWL